MTARDPMQGSQPTGLRGPPRRCVVAGARAGVSAANGEDMAAFVGSLEQALHRDANATQESALSPRTRDATPHANARARRRHNARARRARDPRPAQRAAEALPHALEDVGLPDPVVAAIEGR